MLQYFLLFQRCFQKLYASRSLTYALLSKRLMDLHRISIPCPHRLTQVRGLVAGKFCSPHRTFLSNFQPVITLSCRLRLIVRWVLYKIILYIALVAGKFSYLTGPFSLIFCQFQPYTAVCIRDLVCRWCCTRSPCTYVQSGLTLFSTLRYLSKIFVQKTASNVIQSPNSGQLERCLFTKYK